MRGTTVGYGGLGVVVGLFFQFAFAANAATIVAGTVAERCKFEAYIAYSLMLTGFVYPVVAYYNLSSSGFLSDTTIAVAAIITETNDENNWWK